MAARLHFNQIVTDWSTGAETGEVDERNGKAKQSPKFESPLARSDANPSTNVP
jgi:hypothetical protein